MERNGIYKALTVITSIQDAELAVTIARSSIFFADLITLISAGRRNPPSAESGYAMYLYEAAARTL